MTAATAAAVTDIHEALTGVNGLGTATIAKTLTAYELKSNTPATPEQLARVADAKAGKKDGLKGLALAAWIVTGQGSQEQANADRLKREAAKAGTANAGTTTTPDHSSEFMWPKKASEMLLDYLKAEVSPDADAPNKRKPFINAKGIVRLHSTHWREWLTTQGLEPTKSQAAAPLRDAGLKVQAFPLPGENRSLGFYVGPAPAGTKSLPRRDPQRAARGTGQPRRPASPFSRFSNEQMEYLRTLITKSKKGPMKDAMLALLPEPPAPDDDSAALTQRERDALDSAPASVDAPQGPVTAA